MIGLLRGLIICLLCMLPLATGAAAASLLDGTDLGSMVEKNGPLSSAEAAHAATLAMARSSS